MQLLELFEWISITLGFLVSLVVLAFALVAYRRTRIRRLGVFSLLSALLATTFGLELVDELLEVNAAYVDAGLRGLSLALALVLLLTVIYRVDWRGDP